MEPSTEWKEAIVDGEQEALEGLAQRVVALQRRHARNGRAMRGLHAKGVGGVEATFEVLPGLPEHARVGLFASPGRWPAWVRFSNGVGFVQSDRRPDVRGVAIKVVGVEGRKVIPGLEDAKTQDFLLIRNPSQPFADPDGFVSFLEAVSSPALFLPRVLKRFGPRQLGRIARALWKGLNERMVSVATTNYYSALPIRFGSYAVKCALRPHEEPAPGAKPGTTRNHLGEDLARRLASGPVVFDFQVQFFTDEASTPIEDASLEWLTPFVTVGRLTLPRQPLDSERGRRIASFVEGLSFDPWHALEAHRPLGQMMRARNAAYRLSTLERGAAPEPDGSERFDDDPPALASA